jgi:hypothetical protein
VRQVRLISWQGAPAVLATAPLRETGKAGATVLQVLRVVDNQVTAVAGWTVPGDVRWAEPLRTATGQQEWLALRGDGWYLGRDDGGTLTWRRACACPSIFGEKEDPDPLGPHFSRNLSGDGLDELVLPDPEGLTVYRWVADAGVMEPLWRYRWEAPLLRDPKRAGTWQLPGYWLLDTRNTGSQELVLHHADRLTVYPHPGPVSPRYAFNGAVRVRLESVPLPAGLRKALAALGDVSFPDVARLVAALPLPAEPKARGEWLATLPAALWAAQAQPKVVLPETLRLPGAPKLHAGDYAFPVALEDLTGNGQADLLQATVRTESSALGLRGELRLYNGTETEGRWSFPDPGQPIATAGAAVAELFRTGTSPAAPAALAVASTDATLGAILRSLSSGKVRLELDLHVLQEGRFNPKPDQRSRITLEGISSGARPLVLAADLDGDGWRELLINRRPDRMVVYAGSPSGPRIGAPALGELSGPVPRKPQEVFVADLDGSHRETLVFWYRSGRYDAQLRQTLRFLRWRE